ncbi:hypothetical protein [Microbacterium sp. No. 7]|uniref:hypothetical protein n=1 Tax=Microbacterium sp. No. 7 TaxID=1714373 RepID=UPI0006D13B7E|nr:hypothetical protein [Microbacterium sp. No. 7]ALJ19092.1 hypothetical protein AOA12_03900 [Microbacterium sp. No. 7]
MAIAEILPSHAARDELPKALRRFRAEGESAAPLIFGAHRKPEAVVIPFELYSQLLPAIEEIEIAKLVRERSAAGEARPLSELAEQIGLNPADYS